MVNEMIDSIEVLSEETTWKKKDRFLLLVRKLDILTASNHHKINKQ